MTDHVIQHTDTNLGLTTCSTVDGQEVVVRMGEERVSFDHKNANEWYQTFTLLALMPPSFIETLLSDVPPEHEDLRPFLTACQKSPGTAATFALLFNFALADAKALRRTSPAGRPGDDWTRGTGGPLP